MEKKKKNDQDLRVKMLPSTKMGRPRCRFRQVKSFLRVTCKGGGVVMGRRYIAGALGIIHRKQQSAGGDT